MSNRSSPAPPGTPPGTAPIPDEQEADADLPLTMAASVFLTGLPKDAKSALEGAGDMPRGYEKGMFETISIFPYYGRSQVFRFAVIRLLRYGMNAIFSFVLSTHIK
jgi:hypothetical protein